MKVVIIGGVAGGASCAARLRRLDETADIILVERGPYVSYANCGLPYYVGGVIEQESSLFVADEKTFKIKLFRTQKIMKFPKLFLLAALTMSMASVAKVSIAHDHEPLLDQEVQTLIAQGTSVTFTDIAKNPYQKEIIEAQKLNIIQGFPDGTFRPNQPVTREQAVSMIVDAIALMTPVDLNATPTSPVRPFLDVPGDRWSAAKINWAQWNLLPAGSPTGKFRPEEPITRADLVSFLRRAAERIKTNLGQPPVLSPTQAAIAFTDVSGFNQQLTDQMSGFCQVASPLNEKGTKFAPTQPAHRDYTAAAIVRTLNCLAEQAK